MPYTKKKVISTIPPELKQLVVASGDKDETKAFAAQKQLALALQAPIREGILQGDIASLIYETVQFEPGQPVEWPIDVIVPGTENEYVAFTLPLTGMIPQKQMEGDYITIPTYDSGASIDWPLKFAQRARWDVITRFMAILEGMFAQKLNNDGFETIIAAGVDRNVVVTDSNAPVGYLTKRLISNMKTAMRRGGGGNSGSMNRIRLTDLFISVEGMEDIRNWDLTMVDEVTRREIHVRRDDVLSEIFGVILHELDELGDTQSYQNYYTSIGGSLGSDEELAIGLDLSDNGGSSFIMPVVSDIEIFPDPALHRRRLQGFYAWREHGLGVLDNRKVLFGTF